MFSNATDVGKHIAPNTIYIYIYIYQFAGIIPFNTQPTISYYIPNPMFLRQRSTFWRSGGVRRGSEGFGGVQGAVRRGSGEIRRGSEGLGEVRRVQGGSGLDTEVQRGSRGG